MGKKKYYGIRFPFTSKDRESFFLDLDYLQHKQIKNDLMHILFTPKGSRLRDPEFGCDLVKYLFNPSDNITAFDIKLTIQQEISKYMPTVKINSIDVNPNESNNKIMDVKISYTVDNGFNSYEDEINTSL
ncbi:MAG: GPW/gp25 family protein [Novosphingobium sp.]|nr:GPW/gp25 family protein [Novosphingobium sp.]